jgi:hypothetical protein
MIGYQEVSSFNKDALELSSFMVVFIFSLTPGSIKNLGYS